MSYIYAERLIEYAIRIGVDDIQKDPELVNLMFFTDEHLREGADLGPNPEAPTDPDKRIKEALPYDYFQKRLNEIPKRQAETGQQKIFHNSIPTIKDIKGYLDEANIRIVHGFPREEKDLPCISITLGNEDEQQYLGTLKDTIQVGKKKYELIGSDWKAQYMIQILSPNYDETVVWYHLIKYALHRYRPHLEAYGMREQSISWMDVELASQFAQSGLYVYQRSGILNCVKDEDIPIIKEGFDELSFGLPGSGTTSAIVPNPDGTEPIHPLEFNEGE